MHLSKRIGKKGFTLPEVIISIAILTGIVAMTTNYMMASWNTQSVVQTESYLKSRSEEGLRRLSRQLAQSRRLFGSASAGPAYQDRMNLSAAPPPISSTQFPNIRTLGSMSPEKNCEDSPSEYFLPNSVGNALLFASVAETHRLTKDDGFNVPRDIDIYRFNFVYITDSPLTGQVPLNFLKAGPVKYAQNLIHWQSVKVADYLQLNNYYTDLVAAGLTSKKADVSSSLNAAGIDYAWVRNSNTPTANTFYQISGGNLNVRNASFQLPQYKFEDALRLQNTGSTTYSVAYNTQNDTSHPGYFPTGPLMKVPHYYRPTLDSGLDCPQVTPVPTATPASGAASWAFPRGFEVVIVGPQSGRSVLMHISLAAKGAVGKNVVMQNHSLTTYARDL